MAKENIFKVADAVSVSAGATHTTNFVKGDKVNFDFYFTNSSAVSSTVKAQYSLDGTAVAYEEEILASGTAQYRKTSLQGVIFPYVRFAITNGGTSAVTVSAYANVQ